MYALVIFFYLRIIFCFPCACLILSEQLSVFCFHCTLFSPPPSSSFLLSSFNLLLSLPLVQLSLPHGPPRFSNRRLEINSTLVWPETLVELNMND
uniref:Uncharacterized protein n=1 Tax=Dicentrarchus labrax TaxID=13489 RepID=A0A8P4KI44_DICLA